MNFALFVYNDSQVKTKVGFCASVFGKVYTFGQNMGYSYKKLKLR